QKNDSSLIYGHPQSERSDEWLNWTQITISQSKTGFHKNNPDMVAWQLGLQIASPFKDWSTIFRPYNWVYFILPIENAFAFQWWLPLLLLLIGAYFFVLRVLCGKKALAILFSLAVGLSPF